MVLALVTVVAAVEAAKGGDGGERSAAGGLVWNRQKGTGRRYTGRKEQRRRLVE
jgi:hypothetical protein